MSLFPKNRRSPLNDPFKGRLAEALIDKKKDIEKYIAASSYYNRDHYPYDGRYYNREKWLKKFGRWNYD